MVEFRPDATDLVDKLKRRPALVRRIALAVGAALFGIGLGTALGSRGMAALTMGLGGGIVGFFAPAFTGQS